MLAVRQHFKLSELPNKHWRLPPNTQWVQRR